MKVRYDAFLYVAFRRWDGNGYFSSSEYHFFLP